MTKLLLDSSKNAIYKLDEKKRLLQHFITFRKDIVVISRVVDEEGKSNLEEMFDKTIPSKAAFISKGNNSELAKKIIDLHIPSRLLLSHLLQNEKKKLDAVARLRQKSKEAKQKRDSLTVFIEDFVKKMERLDELVLLKRQSSQFPNIKFPTLSTVQRERKYDEKRIPKNSGHCICLFCGHPSINEPIENEAVVEFNTKVDEIYTQKLSVWTSFLSAKEKNENTVFPKDPFDTTRIMRRAPSKGKYKSAIHQCHCSSSKCLMMNSDIGSTCPIKCVDSDTGVRYATEGIPQQCSCVVCKCECTSAYYVTDIPRIGLEISWAQKKQSNIDQHENSIQQFVGDMFGSALSTAMAIQREYKNNINAMKSLSAEQKEQMLYDCELNTKDSFFEAAALNVVKKANGRTSAIDRNKLASQMGTATFVTLPGGSKFDTRVIGRPSSQHASNNKLVGPAKKQSTPPGMQSNLHIKFDGLPVACNEKRRRASFITPKTNVKAQNSTSLLLEKESLNSVEKTKRKKQKM